MIYLKQTAHSFEVDSGVPILGGLAGEPGQHSSGVPMSDTRSGPTVLPDLGCAKQAVAVSGLAPRGWLP